MCSLYETWQLNFSPAIDDLLGGGVTAGLGVTQKLASLMQPASFAV